MNETRASRRHFIRHLTAASMTLPMLNWIRSVEAARETKTATKPRSMILLWMGGGPSTIDLFDLKPGHPNGGEFRPIQTTGEGQICEHLPSLAKQMKHLSIIRSYNSVDAAHERGTYINHTAYAPVASVTHPAIGAVVAKFNTPPNFDIPGHVSLGGPGVTPGFLGTAYAPFRVSAGTDPVPNLMSRADAVQTRWRRELWKASQDSFIGQRRGPLPADHQTIYTRAFHLMSSSLLDTFHIDKEPAKVRERYGDSQFGKDCLLARRLIEAGVPFVEVGFNGWDHHQSIFDNLAGTGRGTARMRQPMVPVLDRGFAALIEDLSQRGLLDTTLVVWMGDFGRTPKINQDGGRDHWPGGWSVVLGGGGIQGGRVVGATDADGMAVTARPVDVSNLFATMYKAVGIEPSTELRSPNGRPLKLAGAIGDGKVIGELF